MRISQFNQLIEDFSSTQNSATESMIAQMWDLSTTHAALVFKLHCPSTKSSIYLACINTIKVNCSYRWENAQIKARMQGGLCEVFDIEAGMTILCSDVNVIERESYLG